MTTKTTKTTDHTAVLLARLTELADANGSWYEDLRATCEEGSDPEWVTNMLAEDDDETQEVREALGDWRALTEAMKQLAEASGWELSEDF